MDPFPIQYAVLVCDQIAESGRGGQSLGQISGDDSVLPQATEQLAVGLRDVEPLVGEPVSSQRDTLLQGDEQVQDDDLARRTIRNVVGLWKNRPNSSHRIPHGGNRGREDSRIDHPHHQRAARAQLFDGPDVEVLKNRSDVPSRERGRFLRVVVPRDLYARLELPRSAREVMLEILNELRSD